MFREQYLDAVASIIAEQETAGLDIVTDGDSRFDLTVGGKSWFFYPIERLGGITGHRDTSRGWMSRHGLRPGKILWEVQEAYQPGVVGEKLTRGPLEYAAIWQVAQRMTDRPVKFGAICAPAMAGMLWNAFYRDDKEMMLDLCDIMNAELRDMADAGCPLIQVEEPPHHMRAQQKECTDADLEFLTEAFNRQLTGVNAEIWVHTCWGNPNQQRVHYNVPSYERALPHLLQLNGDVLTIECASSDGKDLPLFKHIKTDKKIAHRRGQPLRHGGRAGREGRGADPQGAGVHPEGAAHHLDRLRLRPRGPVAAHRVLQVRGAGRGHQYRAPRAWPSGSARARGRSEAVVRGKGNRDEVIPCGAVPR